MITSEQVPGIPDGYELVRIGKLQLGDSFVDSFGEVGFIEFEQQVRAATNFSIIRRIEEPVVSEKTLPGPGEWWRMRGGGLAFIAGVAPDAMDEEYPVAGWNEDGLQSWTRDGWFYGDSPEHNFNLIEHVPDCTGFDYVPPVPWKRPDWIPEGSYIAHTSQNVWVICTEPIHALSCDWSCGNQSCYWLYLHPKNPLHAHLYSQMPPLSEDWRQSQRQV